MQPGDYETAFEIPTPWGLCVAVRLPLQAPSAEPDELPDLHPDEVAFASSLPGPRRITWIGGRIALRRAMRAIGEGRGPIFANPRGAPSVPPGIAASLSHKRVLAVAIATRMQGATLGIDIEDATPRNFDIARRVLVPEELQALQRLPETERWLGFIARFSLKESTYKAIDPFVARYVAFAEATVRVGREPGDAAIALELKNNEGPFDIAAWWTIRDGHIISVVRASPACGGSRRVP